LREIRAYGRHLRDSSTVDESEVYEQQKHIAVTLVLVVVMFIVCWTPLVVYAIYSTLVRDEDRIHHLANPVVSIRTVKLRSGGTPPPLFLLFPSLSFRLSPFLFIAFTVPLFSPYQGLLSLYRREAFPIPSFPSPSLPFPFPFPSS